METEPKRVVLPLSKELILHSFNHRSFQNCSFWDSGGFLERRIPGLEIEGTPSRKVPCSCDRCLSYAGKIGPQQENHLFCLVSGKQRDPKKAKKERELILGKFFSIAPPPVGGARIAVVTTGGAAHPVVLAAPRLRREAQALTASGSFFPLDIWPKIKLDTFSCTNIK